MPSPRPVVLLAIACLLALAAAPAHASDRAPSPAPILSAHRPIQAVYEPLEIFADTLAKQRGVDVAHAWADSVGRAAQARGDRATAAAATLWRGKRYATHEYDLDRGRPFLDRALAEATALRDTFAMSTVWVRRAWGEQIKGQREPARADYVRGLALAHAGHLPWLEGLAHRGLGAIAKEAGHYDVARRELTAALRTLPEETQEHLRTRLVLGEVLNRTGHPDAARERFEDVLAEARKRQNRWTIAAALQDLGIVAFSQGDMAEADRMWAEAATLQDTLVLRKMVSRDSAIGSRLNRAHALIVLGRSEEARRILEQQLGESAQVDDPDTRNSVLGELGSLLRRAGRIDEAERTLRLVRAAAAADDAELEESSSLELAGLLRESNRAGEALALTDSLLAPGRRARLMSLSLGSAWLERSAALRALGRPAEALTAAREGERVLRVDRSQPSIAWLDAAVELARCQSAVGRPDDAVATLARGARAWEGWRSQISDLEWRERAGSGLSGLFSTYGLALLDPRRAVPHATRARQAFDALQAFQARTLEERMHGAGLAGRAMAARVSADSLSRAVLGPGEALLDWVATPETTFAFVVTRGGVTARTLPGTVRLDALHRDWRDAMLAGAESPVVEDGLARLSTEALAPLAPALRGAHRVIVTGGGALALWPWGALTLPGEAAPLGERREVACVPSASLFATLRARGNAAGATPRLLAVSRTTDAEGRALPGAVREMDMLGRDFAHVTVRENRGDRPLRELTADLAGFDALHFAAHVEADPGTPWRSGLLLGSGTGDGAYFRASNVARLKLRARLVVLSGCQSAGATAVAGEGAIGLSTGFLSAGTRTVVATLWPVADRDAERYMSAFYDGLAGGRTVAAAALGARSALRAQAGTANPRSWAAFVVLGEPGTTFPLARRGRD